jgi:hypothetical protein
MKIKQLLLSFITLSVFVVSCSKEDITGVDFEKTKIEQSQELNSTSSTNPNLRVTTSSTPNLKAYVFIEKQAKTTLIVNYLKNSVPRNPQSTSVPFYSCWTMVSIKNTNYRDLNNYLNMPFWTNGVLPQVIQADIPQVSGGVDEHGNPKMAYNFTTVKISKNTVNDNAWVLVLIPVSAMNNDTKRQTRIGYYAKNGTRIVSSANNSQTVLNTNTQLSSYLINYTGNVIPQGQYRVYSTYPNSSMRINFNMTNDVYLRGFSN